MSHIAKILVLSVLLSPVLALPAQAAEVSFDQTGAIVIPGSTIDLQIIATLLPGEELAGGRVDLRYDDSVVEILNVTVDPAVWDFLPGPGSKTGPGRWQKIFFDVFDNPPATGNTVIATVTLEARGAGVSALSILPSSQFFSTTVQIAPIITGASITVNTAPVAADDAYSVGEGATLDVAAASGASFTAPTVIVTVATFESASLSLAT
jgi:hypothetical protein